MNNNIRILVIEEQAMLRESMVRVISTTGGMEVVGQCAGTTEAARILRSLIVDVVVLDYDTDSGTEFLPQLRGAGFNGAVVVLAEKLTVQQGIALVTRGVSAICEKNESLANVMEAVRLAAIGVTTIDERYFRPALEMSGGSWNLKSPPPVPAKTSETLRNREQEVIANLLRGLSNQAIAERMGVSETLVKAALYRIYRANGVHTRAQLVALLLKSHTVEMWAAAG